MIIIDHDNFELTQLITKKILSNQIKSNLIFIRASGVNKSNELTSLINDQKSRLFCVARNSLEQKKSSYLNDFLYLSTLLLDEVVYLTI